MNRKEGSNIQIPMNNSMFSEIFKLSINGVKNESNKNHILTTAYLSSEVEAPTAEWRTVAVANDMKYFVTRLNIKDVLTIISLICLIYIIFFCNITF